MIIKYAAADAAADAATDAATDAAAADAVVEEHVLVFFCYGNN